MHGSSSPRKGQRPADPRPRDRARTQRRRLEIAGRVQGVGFRPFVYRLARALSLGGFVGNNARGAFIEIEGSAGDVAQFAERLRRELPPLARITGLEVSTIPPTGEKSLDIVASDESGHLEAEVSADVATCAACLEELRDPKDRRYRYPFLNCTDCGPRYSIVRSIPYDRPCTTMATFAMCDDCRAEYEDPNDRRFHAQPIACPRCGPRLWLAGPDGDEIDGDPVERAAAALREGALVAIKGLGGFHLACRADDPSAVARLRERKARETKPLALMVGSLGEARRITRLHREAASVLADPVRPIVLLPRLEDAQVARAVAPVGDRLGVMLPYTPLHTLLFDEGLGPLVMTSGNRSEEPLAATNDDALARLRGVADLFLLHDRAIERPIDDSVVLPFGSELTPASQGGRAGCGSAIEVGAGGFFPLRRARGLVPASLALSSSTTETVLAVGGDLKSVVCLLDGSTATLSEHLGDLAHPAAYRNFLVATDRLSALFSLEPRVVACDLHPGYLSSRFARRLGKRLVEVQHHHAHVVSCMADNGLSGSVIGISCDGTGYGTDGAVWGGEVLVADERTFLRAAHLRYFALPGGDAAAIDTWRPAAGLLHAAFGKEWVEIFSRLASPEGRGPGAAALDLVAGRLGGSGSIPYTSSLGRLFDAVAFLLGTGDRNGHEAEAAMAVESAARSATSAEELSIDLAEEEGVIVLDHRGLVRDLVARVRSGRPASALALGFHRAVARGFAQAAARAARVHDIRRVVLSGGCFANEILRDTIRGALEAAGCGVHFHRNVPPGDGGLALGQAVTAAALLVRDEGSPGARQGERAAHDTAGDSRPAVLKPRIHG